MSNHFEEYLTKIETTLPDLIPDTLLYELGLFNTPSHLSRARDRGDAPPAIRVTSKKYLTTKQDLIAWLRDRRIVGKGVAND